MAVMVCLRCGEFRGGLSRPCEKCGYLPEDARGKAKQCLTTDRYHSPEELAAIAARVKSGEVVEFDREMIHAGRVRQAIKRLTAEFGTVPPPWVVHREHPSSICWRMGGGESHLTLWWEWWPTQKFTEEQKIEYFRNWPPPHCWLGFLIEAIWDVDRRRDEDKLPLYFARTHALGFGSQEDYERDLNDPKWLVASS